MSNSLRLLQDCLETQEWAHSSKRILFLNGIAADIFCQDNINIYQYFKPLALSDDLSFPDGPYDMVLLLGSKQVQEFKYHIALGLTHLKDHGILLVAADNKENGKRLSSWLEELNLTPENYAGHKARCCIVYKSKDLKSDVLEEWKQGGIIQKNEIGFYTQPGLFSWNRIDPASRLLIDTINEPLKGDVADFGCGYGYLSVEAAKQNKEITSLDGYDADARALICYEKNLKALNTQTSSTIWADLGKTYQSSKKYDFILMNPPFHEGRKETTDLGISFLENASNALKHKGVLWMVANKHLPYEQTLERCFTRTDKVIEKEGFKIYRCVK